MKIFHCDHCHQLIFFENSTCTRCGHALAFLPDLGVMGSLDPLDATHWRSPLVPGRTWRLCRNYSEHDLCNWAVDARDPESLCRSCRLTQLIPDLSVQGNRDAWFRLEVAKRRAICNLLQLRLPVRSRDEDPGHGLAFEFMAATAGQPAVTGHATGVITIDIAEADDAQREKLRAQLGEAYRTVLGHIRHEIGHYYWDLLVRDGHWLEPFRRWFGDERQDYQAALQRHYAAGPASAWQARFVSAYASAHPWEDWAETWAHYLHMVDTLETAAAAGVSLQPWRSDEPRIDAALVPRPEAPFDRLIQDWYPLTYLLNNLNRGMGLPDAYPFVLSPPAVEKLRFVHAVVASASG